MAVMGLADKVERASLDEEKNPIAHAWAILAGILLFSLFIRMLWIRSPVVRDEGVSGYVAMVWARGLSPYSYPMAAVNPPIAYLIYLALLPLFGNTIIPARIINDALYVVSIVVLYLMARDWYNETVGLVAALFYGLFMNAPIFETHLAIPSSLSISFIIASAYSFSVYLRNSRKSALFYSGLLMSVASLILQYQAVGVILLFVMLIYYRYKAFKQRKETRSLFVKNLRGSICILAIGVVLPILVIAGYFWSQGALVGLIQSTVFRFLNLEYISQPDVYPSVIFLIGAEAMPLWLFSLVGFVRCFSRKSEYDIFLIAWTIFFLIIAIPPSHFGRHFSQLLPPASLLSGVAIASISKETGVKPTLKRFHSNAHNAQKKVAGTFFIVILVASFIPIIFSQPTQYPNTNFSLFNEDMYYTFSSNWNEQQEIVDYITSHTGNGSILIHGWEAELYWLSGNLAPNIRWASSYKSGVPDITDDEYEKILNRAKAGDFELVVLMSGFPPDDIMRYVPERYFFVKNIGLYAIYSKYNAEGYSVEYSFVENLPQAFQRYTLDNGTQGNLKDLVNGQIYLPIVEEITINGEKRTAIKQHPIAAWDSHMVDSNLVYGNISISPHSRLSFGIAIHPDVWDKTDGVVFKILVQHEGRIDEMFSEYNNPNRNVEDRKWQDYLVDLDEFGGKSISIYFVTNPGPNGNNAYNWAYWSKPLVLESH
jgi:4-amino-4-deoxy-L-arabinose transferase-like glycosyltransferase